jgi:predicted MFS family arabinose efflux permease
MSGLSQAAARRDLRVVVAAVGISAAGDIAAVAALAVHLQERTGSGLLVAALFAANWLAIAVGSPWAGALVDRRDARSLLVLASLGQAAVAAVLATTPPTAAILVLSALLGVGAAVAVPSEFALVGVIAAAGDGSARANGRVETARYAGYLVGPLLGTGLVALSGVGATLALDAASFALVAVAAVGLSARRPAATAAGGPRPRARDGLALLVGDRELRATTFVLVASLLTMSMTIAADVFFVRETLGQGAFGLGLLLSAWMAGMVVASLSVAPRVPLHALATVAIAAAAVQGAGKLGAASLGLVVPALVLYALGGAAHGIKNVTARTLLHERVPAEAHGRAFAAYAGLRNTAELGALALGGLLVDAIGGRATLIVAGSATALVAAAGLLLLPRNRTGEAHEPRPAGERVAV